MIPATQMERELMAPSDGPISITCTVAGRTHGRPTDFLYLLIIHMDISIIIHVE